MSSNYCRECGTKLVPKELDHEGLVPYCPSCGQYTFPQYNVAVIWNRFPPSFTNGEGLKAYITNIYTDPDYRGREIAPEILLILEKRAMERSMGPCGCGDTCKRAIGVRAVVRVGIYH